MALLKDKKTVSRTWCFWLKKITPQKTWGVYSPVLPHTHTNSGLSFCSAPTGTPKADQDGILMREILTTTMMNYRLWTLLSGEHQRYYFPLFPQHYSFKTFFKKVHEVKGVITSSAVLVCFHWARRRYDGWPWPILFPWLRVDYNQDECLVFIAGYCRKKNLRALEFLTVEGPSAEREDQWIIYYVQSLMKSLCGGWIKCCQKEVFEALSAFSLMSWSV